ncbi:rhamnan synthesis F family protein [Brackiella oedipodis]|uniref:rhamnan synthesis F family protein n=1 Tax=Brackiella oedipodis TaxID=124225 RepID=UPI00146F9E10|nr:rhamnan synthesis F family protein [Brackiella oedipodis]
MKKLYYKLPDPQKKAALEFVTRTRLNQIFILPHIAQEENPNPSPYNYQNGNVALLTGQELATYDQTVTDASAPSPSHPGRVAIHCHIFYVDLLDEFVQQIKEIPFEADLYVSVTDTEAKQQCQEKFQSIVQIKHLYVDIVPNIGRDIAPMFAHFGKALSQYDYIAHLQSKKSLHHQGISAGWREYLLNALFGSRANISRIFEQFIHNPKLGIVYPQPFISLSYLPLTWLGNQAEAQRLLGRMNLPMPHGYLYFPAGSMFWARTQALKPIFDLNLQLQDFPDEDAQKDGTLGHTLERLIGIVPDAQGYQTIVLKDTQFPAWNYFRFDQFYLHRSYQHYQRLINKKRFQVIVVDVFNTLLNTAFMQSTEAHIKAQVGAEHVLDVWSLNEDVHKLMHMAKEAGKKVVLIADSDCAQAQIEALLKRLGVKGWEQLFVEPADGSAKASGAIFQTVCQQQQVSTEQLLVFGDDEYLDVHLPYSQFNIKSFHILKGSHLAPTLSDYGRVSRYVTELDDVEAELTLGILIQHNFNQIAEFKAEQLSLYAPHPWYLGFNILGPAACVTHELAEQAPHLSVAELHQIHMDDSPELKRLKRAIRETLSYLQAQPNLKTYDISSNLRSGMLFYIGRVKAIRQVLPDFVSHYEVAQYILDGLSPILEHASRDQAPAATTATDHSQA